MLWTIRCVAVASVVGVAGCAPEPVPDLAAERQALLEADALFLAAADERGADGWADFFLSDGVQFPGSGRTDGREAIRALMGPMFAPGEPRLVWTPTDAHVGSGGDLGYTLGQWQTVAGDTVVHEGNYVTIWRKDDDGTWRVAVDIGNTAVE